MVRTSEDAYSTKVRLFKWNEKLDKDVVSETEGFFVFHVHEILTTTSTTPPGGDVEDVEERTLANMVRFELSRLLSRDSVESLACRAVEASKLFLPETVQPLGRKISAYLNSTFRFSADSLLRRRSPRTVIHVEVHRVMTVEYTEEDFVCPPPSTHPPVIVDNCDLDDDAFPISLSSDSDDDYFMCVDYDTEEGDNDVEWYYTPDVCEIARELRTSLRVRGIFPMKPIASDEPFGLVQVGPDAALEITKFSDHVDGPVDKCSICLEEFALGTEIARTSCSHVFHRICIFSWLQDKHSCPMCRSVMNP